MITLNIDDDLRNADWTKQTWDLPPYKSEAFNKLFPDLAHFKTLPVYQFAVRNGVIVNDEWTGKVSKRDDDGTQARDSHGRWANSGGGAEGGEMTYYDLSRGKAKRPVDTPSSNARALLILARVNGLKESTPIKEVMQTLVESATETLAHPRLAFINEVGKIMDVKPAPPKDMMEQHRCYNNSIEKVIEGMYVPLKREYIEGVITEHGIPLAHGWVREGSDKHHTFVDYTVDSPGHEYMGVLIPRKVWGAVATTNAFGRGDGEGVIGTILNMRDGPKKEKLLQQIREANK